MPLMMSKIYDALLSAGVTKLEAMSAAEEVAAYESRFISIEHTIGLSEVRINSRFDNVEQKLDAMNTTMSTKLDAQLHLSDEKFANLRWQMNLLLIGMGLIFSGVVGTLLTLARK